ncbi:MAG: 50S ribosomal protein L11 methyltransferase [Actinomycetota bacterium]
MRGERVRSTERADLRRPLTHHLVVVPLDGHDPELLGLELWEAGAVGIEDLPGALRVAFDAFDAAAGVRDRYAPGAAIEELPDVVGLDASRDLLAVRRAGRFAIHPPWLTPPADLIGVEIDPGHAFGSGSHPSTRLALELIGRHVAPGATVADIGCGSGVLAIGAALVGAASVTAVDIDPAAIDATTANAARNGVGDIVDARLGSASDVPAPDTALINVTIDVHELLAPALPRAANLIIAGVLTDQLARAAAAHRAEVVDSLDDDEWSAAWLRPGGRGPSGSSA